MSITNLKKTFENNTLVYCNLNNETIVECICLTELYPLNEHNKFNDKNKKFLYFRCDKVKIITIYNIHKNINFKPIQNNIFIYNIYKNIISKPIHIYLFKDPIKVNNILENLDEKKNYYYKTFIETFSINDKLNGIEYTFEDYDNQYCILEKLNEKKNHYYKTFTEAFLINNELNGIKYGTDCYNTTLYVFSYDNIHCNLSNYGKEITYNYNNDIGYNIIFLDNNTCYIYYYENNNIIIYIIDNDYIRINNIKKPYDRIIYFHKKDLKNFKIEEYYNDRMIYSEKRNYNNEIISWKKYNKNNKLKKKIVFNNKNPPFSKPLKRYYIKVINHCNKNINIFIKIINSMFKKISKAQYNLLLNYNLEKIDFK